MAMEAQKINVDQPEVSAADQQDESARESGQRKPISIKELLASKQARAAANKQKDTPSSTATKKPSKGKGTSITELLEEKRKRAASKADETNAESATGISNETAPPVELAPEESAHLGIELQPKGADLQHSDEISSNPSSGELVDEDESVPRIRKHSPAPKSLVAKPKAIRPYPVDAFGSLAPFVQLVAMCVQVAPSMVGGALIGMLSAVLQALINVSVRSTDSGMPVSLNIFLIAESGERKSSTIQAIAKPIYAAIRNAADKRRRMIVQDVTVDGLVVGLIERCPAQLLLVLEAAALFGSHAMSKDNLMRFLGILSSLFSGESISRTRVDEHYHAEDRRLSTVVFAQPVVATEFLSSELVMQQGFGNRFIYDQPESLRGSREYVDRELELDPVYQEFCEKMARLASQEWSIGEDTGGIVPRVLRLAPEAKELWVEHYNQNERGCQSGEKKAAHAGYVSRFSEQTLRLAALLTVVAEPEATEVTEDAMARAIKLGEYYLDSAITLFSSAPANAEERNAQTLLEWMRNKQVELELQAIPVRMIYKDGPRCARPSKKTRELLTILEGRGEIAKWEHTVRYENGKSSAENYAVTL